MKKKIYTAPEVLAYDLNLTEIICDSKVDVKVGNDKITTIDAAQSRNSDWDEYLRQ